MANPFYSAVAQQPQANGGPIEFMNMVQQFKSNPMGFILQRRLNVPAEIANDPNAILNHLLQTRQISQAQVNFAYQKLQNGGINRSWQINK